jgi:flagella basal body P-ring formation protein FlgA
LLPAAHVDSSGVYLHQLVAQAPTRIKTQSTPQISPSHPIRLADAPPFGRAASFTPSQINDLLNRAASGVIVTNWSGAPRVRVVRRARPLAESELLTLVTATLQSQVIKDRGDLELRLSRPWAPVSVPDETLSLNILDMPASGVGPNFILRFELLSGKDRLGPWQVVLKARIMKDVPVARVLLRRRQPLRKADFTTERRDILPMRQPLDVSTIDDPTLELVENLSAGRPLLARSVRIKPAVQRGQLVNGLMHDGSLSISLKVEVLAEALPGETVRVRNPRTKREFYAKVQDEQTVLISL